MAIEVETETGPMVVDVKEVAERHTGIMQEIASLLHNQNMSTLEGGICLAVVCASGLTTAIGEGSAEDIRSLALDIMSCAVDMFVGPVVIQ
jgi:hypothetical protein